MVMRKRRAHRLAQLAGDAALLAVRVAAQRVQAAKARALRGLLLGIVHGDLGAEHAPASVTDRPLSSSQSRKVLRKLRMRLHYRLLLPRAHVGICHDALDHEPDQRHRNQHLPAQAHDLIVAIAREGRAQPEKAEHRHESLQPEPEKARVPRARTDRRQPAVERREPAAEEEYRRSAPRSGSC